LEVTVRGETAWSRVRLRVAMTQPEGKVVRREGYVMSIYAKQPAGRWQLVRDANLLGPPQPA
jgi:ketosteroid isomerase-like protein